MSKQNMTTEEAFIKILQRHGIDSAFGIIGSAMMPVTDLFPKAGITFWDCAHEFWLDREGKPSVRGANVPLRHTGGNV